MIDTRAIYATALALVAHAGPACAIAPTEQPEAKKSRQVLRAEARRQAIVIECDPYRESRAERYDLKQTHPSNPKRRWK